MVIASNAGAEVEAEGLNGLDGFGDIVGFEAAGEEDGDIHGFTDFGADGPVVLPTGAAEFFDGEALVAGIQQDSVNVWGQFAGFVDGGLAADVHDLHNGDAGQCFFQLLVGAFL